MKAKAAGKKLNFEKALERLESVVREMEDGALSLDEMMSHFEEGTRLVKFCSQKLNEVEQKIEILVKKDGKTITQPLDIKEESNRAE